MNIRPLRNKVVVRRQEGERTTQSGIVLPEHNIEKPARGEVMAIGPDVKFTNLYDIVMFGKYAGTEVKVNGNDYLIIDEDDIWGVVDGG